MTPGALTPLDDLLGASPGIEAVRAQVTRLLGRGSGSRALPPILIQGETGTGKGLLARTIHRAGPRAAAPFIDVNCAAIPETLLEAEMFGFERGAFTDARQAKPGLFQAAQHGTIFLDEIGLLPAGLQAKLLKVIEERSVRRLGSTRAEAIDVAIITASNLDLAAAARERRFREDLYHRLAVLTLRLPPLRERSGDILALAERFLARACADYDLPAKELSANARAALLAHSWPGNVRELGNVIERVALLSESRVIDADMLGLPGATVGVPPAAPEAGPAQAQPEADADGEGERLREALEATAWNISHAAARLGISRNTLRYRIEKHGLRPGATAPAMRRSAKRPAPLVPSPPPPPRVAEPSSGSRVRWDRRRVTLLRAALVASAETDAASSASSASEAFVEKVQSFGGRVEERSPTGIVAAFGLEPLENAPTHAAHAAMAIQKAAERAGRDGAPVAVSVGIHVGVFLVGEGGGPAQIDLDAKREAWVALDALLARGETGAVLATEAAATFLERGFDLVPLDDPGQPGAPVYHLTGRQRSAPAFGRPKARFVGRRHDLDLLESRLASARAGRGQLVGIVGEAGLGKSRLVFELRHALRTRPVTFLEGRCLSYGASMPYRPILEILRQAFGIADGQAPDVIAGRVRATLTAAGMDADEWAPYLLQLLGVQEGTERLTALTAEAIKPRTLETIRQLALRASRQRPIVFVLEDLHWIDRTSEECVDVLVDSVAGAPILFLATYRPGYRPRWMDKSYATQIALQPLGEEDSRAVMRSVLRDAPVSESVARLILDKAEGNPFFIEELSGAVREQGDLPAALEVPDTVQELLLARIHRLPEGPKHALQVASVVGREAPVSVLRAMWDGPGDLDHHLHELVRLELLHERAASAEAVYAFRHALTQEVAYASLPVSGRPALHAAVGRALESVHARRLPDAYEQLAHHFARSGEDDKALEYLTLFAGKAISVYAYDEAARAFAEAQRHLQGLPPDRREPRRLDLVLRQATELIRLGRLGEVVELLLPLGETFERRNEPGLAGRYHFVLSYAYSFMDRERSAQSAERAIAEADRAGDPIIKGKALCLLAQDGPFAGQAIQGIAHARQALELLVGSDEPWWLGRAYWLVALNHGQTGAFPEAFAAAAAADAIAERTGDPRLQTSTAWCTGILHAARGEVDLGVQECRRALERARDPLNVAIATGWLGFALTEKGETAEAIARLEPVTGELSRMGYRPLQSWFTAFLAEAYRLTGQADAAREAARRALHVAMEARVHVAAGWARLVLGRIANDAGGHGEAEEHLRQALDTFASIHSRYEMARTRLDLAVALHGRGDAEGARTSLVEALDVFSKLDVPVYVRRAEALARDLGLSR